MDCKVEISGPWWPDYKLNVGAFEVPYLTVSPPMEDGKPAPLNEDQIYVSCDHRIGIYTTRGELGRWLPFLADCMAVAAGYPCHGATEKMNPFVKKASTELGGIQPDPPNLSLVKGEQPAHAPSAGEEK